MKWITQERVRMDRVACAWLIKNFIDKEAEFSFVSPKVATDYVLEEGVIPFVFPGAELSRQGDRITLDVILKKYNFTEPALSLLADIVRAADMRNSDAEEGSGLRAIVHGFFLMNLPDNDALELQYPVFDALYFYCQEEMRKRN